VEVLLRGVELASVQNDFCVGLVQNFDGVGIGLEELADQAARARRQTPWFSNGEAHASLLRGFDDEHGFADLDVSTVHASVRALVFDDLRVRVLEHAGERMRLAGHVLSGRLEMEPIPVHGDLRSSWSRESDLAHDDLILVVLVSGAGGLGHNLERSGGISEELDLRVRLWIVVEANSWLTIRGHHKWGSP